MATVKTHVRHVLQKLRLRDRQAVLPPTTRPPGGPRPGRARGGPGLAPPPAPPRPPPPRRPGRRRAGAGGAGPRAPGPGPTPSATTRRPRLWARSIVERTIAASEASIAMSITNDLSILISSTGSRLR